MPSVRFVLALAAALFTGIAARADERDVWFDQHREELVGLYRHLHSHPELSYKEVATAARIAEELKKAGAEVTPNVGKHGVVGVLRNGRGPTVLVRSDLDALPVTEATGLPYASKVTVADDSGVSVGVMHACGHDVHMTNLVATARWLDAGRHQLPHAERFLSLHDHPPLTHAGAGQVSVKADVST